MRRFYAPTETFQDGTVRLAGDEAHHLRDVLRLRAGDEVHIYDGEGKEFSGCIDSVDRQSAVVSILAEVPPASPESTLDLTLAAVLLKGDKFDLVVQKAAELGISTLVPLYSARCEVRKGPRADRRERWLRIAQASTRQSGRARNMSIKEPTDLEALLSEVDTGSAIFFSERDGGNLPANFEGKRMTAIVGPEGGWDDAEIDLARTFGVGIVTLGGRVVRAETASIAVTAILLHRFGDIN